MLSLVVTLLIIALIAAVLGFGGIAFAAVEIAKIVFFVALILFLIALVFGAMRGGPRIASRCRGGPAIRARSVVVEQRLPDPADRSGAQHGRDPRHHNIDIHARASRDFLEWFTDEARVGQQGTLTRVWAKRGSRPRARATDATSGPICSGRSARSAAPVRRSSCRASTPRR